jgi:hypothetical protein
MACPCCRTCCYPDVINVAVSGFSGVFISGSLQSCTEPFDQGGWDCFPSTGVPGKLISTMNTGASFVRLNTLVEDVNGSWTVTRRSACSEYIGYVTTRYALINCFRGFCNFGCGPEGRTTIIVGLTRAGGVLRVSVSVEVPTLYANIDGINPAFASGFRDIPCPPDDEPVAPFCCPDISGAYSLTYPATYFANRLLTTVWPCGGQPTITATISI